jgi:hypothetical protein
VTALRLAEGLVLRTDWSRQQQIDKELREGLIVLKGFWRKSRGLCVDKVQLFFPTCHIKENGHGPTCWALDMMMMMMMIVLTRLQSESKCLLLKLSFVYNFTFFFVSLSFV